MKLKNLKRLAVSGAITAALGGAMLVSGPRLYAEDHSECQHKIEKAQARLDDAIRKHGERSHEAEDRRRDLNAEREHCWSKYHGWYDAQEHRWHTERDWDHP